MRTNSTTVDGDRNKKGAFFSPVSFFRYLHIIFLVFFSSIFVKGKEEHTKTMTVTVTDGNDTQGGMRQKVVSSFPLPSLHHFPLLILLLLLSRQAGEERGEEDTVSDSGGWPQ